MTTTPEDIFAACLEQVSKARLLKCADSMGVDFNGEALEIHFFDRVYRMTPKAVEDVHGNMPLDAVGRLLCRYVLQYPSSPPPDGRKVTFRELAGAGPLVSSFARNTNKLIASAFATDTEALAARAKKLNGETHLDKSGWDVSARFQALPNVPVFLHFNAADDPFPAQCNLLFFQSAEQYLDMKSIFILGTWLAGNLVSNRDVDGPADLAE